MKKIIYLIAIAMMGMVLNVQAVEAGWQTVSVVSHSMTPVVESGSAALLTVTTSEPVSDLLVSYWGGAYDHFWLTDINGTSINGTTGTATNVGGTEWVVELIIPAGRTAGAYGYGIEEIKLLSGVIETPFAPLGGFTVVTPFPAPKVTGSSITPIVKASGVAEMAVTTDGPVLDLRISLWGQGKYYASLMTDIGGTNAGGTEWAVQITIPADWPEGAYGYGVEYLLYDAEGTTRREDLWKHLGDFIVDNTPPSVRISHPKDGDITSAVIVVAGSAVDAVSGACSSVAVTMNSDVFACDADGSFGEQLVDKEGIDITVTAVDEAGNVGSDVVTIIRKHDMRKP